MTDTAMKMLILYTPLLLLGVGVVTGAMWISRKARQDHARAKLTRQYRDTA